jgi:hypothetical protein
MVEDLPVPRHAGGYGQGTQAGQQSCRNPRREGVPHQNLPRMIAS